jgi:hypothetical protein
MKGKEGRRERGKGKRDREEEEGYYQSSIINLYLSLQGPLNFMSR